MRSLFLRILLLQAALPAAVTLAGDRVSGIVVDSNGVALPQAQVSLAAGGEQAGADITTVFSGPDGKFAFPETVRAGAAGDLDVHVRALGYAQESADTTGSADGLNLTVIMRPLADQGGVAPASAWLDRIEDREEKARFVLNCVGCHQVPSPEVRHYAAQIEAVRAPDPAVAREQSWLAIVKYMNYISGWEFGRGSGTVAPDARHAYSVGPGQQVAATLARHFDAGMAELAGYDRGAPLIVTPQTVIREYRVPGVNAVREAMLLGTPPKLWVADVASNRVIAIDVATGEQESHEVPFDGASGPHSLHRGHDGSLWVTPFFPSVIARLDPLEGSWRTWPTRTLDGAPIGIHDLSFGAQHELLSDANGLVWYSDIGDNAVGYFSPETGAAAVYHVPDIEGRPSAGAMLYGLVMTSDRKHIWYSQLGIGSFGEFNVDTREFGARVVLPMADAGPRRLTISDRDIMYVPLYGSGQLVEYDTVAHQQLGIYDLPDTGSAPYAVTWDPVRKVVWIATSNADAIYRFDPATKSFGIIPLPRQGALLRMIDIDPASGVLVTCYANIVEFVKGPRMALIVDPGDGAYQRQTEGDAP